MNNFDSQKANKAVLLRIEGRVQGVGFRAFTRRQAVSLGLYGYVCNRADGSVEALLQGDRGQVDEMIKKLRQGPALARVDKITTTLLAPESRFDGFEITI